MKPDCLNENYASLGHNHRQCGIRKIQNLNIYSAAKGRKHFICDSKPQIKVGRGRTPILEI